MLIHGKGFTEVYPELLAHIKKYGENISPRGLPTKEVENLGFVLADPLQCTAMQKSRKFNFAYAVIEFLSLLMPGEKMAEPLCWYNPNMKNFLNENGTFDGSYADRLTRFDQLFYIYDILHKDPDSRRAVLDFYNANLDQHISNDICCTLNIAFRIRDNKLNATCFMRGNDALWGIYDYTMFVFLQNLLASWLGIEVGTYAHIAGSFHYYLDKEEEVDKVINCKEFRGNHPLERMLAWDIKSPMNSIQYVQAFFQVEKLYRNGKQDLAKQILKNSIPSSFLKFYWKTIVKPFIDKKLSKT